MFIYLFRSERSSRTTKCGINQSNLKDSEIKKYMLNLVGNVERIKKWVNKPNKPRGNKKWNISEIFKMTKLKHGNQKDSYRALYMYLIKTKLVFSK